jgi:hypothetical protein
MRRIAPNGVGASAKERNGGYPRDDLDLLFGSIHTVFIVNKSVNAASMVHTCNSLSLKSSHMLTLTAHTQSRFK